MKVDKLDDKWVMVTGAGAGIGRAIAIEAARRGAHLAICDIQDDRLAETAEQLEEYPGEVVTAVVDVSSREAVHDFASRVHTETQAVDILINNAGIALAADILDTSPDDWSRLIGVNLMSVIHCCDAFCPAMKERGEGGHIANIASMEGFAAMEGFGAYSTTKFAVVGYSDALRQELQDDKIGVSVICPGVVNTSLTADMDSRGDYEDGIADRIHKEHEKSNFGPEKVATATFSAIKYNTALRPVAPESWITYFSSRISPRMTSFILKQVAHRVLRTP